MQPPLSLIGNPFCISLVAHAREASNSVTNRVTRTQRYVLSLRIIEDTAPPKAEKVPINRATVNFVPLANPTVDLVNATLPGYEFGSPGIH